MSRSTLSARLTTLSEASKYTTHLIHRLSRLSPNPGPNQDSSETKDGRSELSAEIQQRLKEQEEEFELLRQEAEDQTNSGAWNSSTRRRGSNKEREKTDLATQAARLGEDLRLAHSQFRKAELQAKRNAEAARRKERELLFAGAQDRAGGIGQARRKEQEKQSKNEIALSASSDVTAGLRRIHSLMQSEVLRSQFARETLEQSTATLSTLGESYNSLDTLLSSSRSLVSTLLHSQKSDTWYLETAFWILVCTIIWLIFRRILYGPGWWLVYLPTKLTWQLIIFSSQILFGASASLAGALGARSKSASLSQLSDQYSTSLIIQPSATGDIPKFKPGMSAPSIGFDRERAKEQPSEPQSGAQSISEQVGEMAEKGQREADEQTDSGTVLRERREDEAPNPKKRMWQENVNSHEQGDRQRDEL